MNAKEKVKQSIIQLLRSEPFYAHYVLNSVIMYDAFNIPTAGVFVRDGKSHIVFNTEFVKDFQTPEICAIIKHEILHLLFDHTEMLELDPEKKHLWNIAMDCAINQHISNLPEGAITLKALKELTQKDLEPLQTSEYYYQHIQEKYEELKNQATLDEHDIDAEGQDKGASRKAAVQATAKKAANSAAGNMSSDLLKLMESLMDSKLPWRQILKNFVTKQISKTSRNTRKKINRRFGLDAPGRIKLRTLKLGVCVDSSGSIDDVQFQSFMSEIKSIVTQGIELVLVDADCEVKSVEKIKSKKDFKPKRTGNGGTAYQPAISECLKHRCDAIIYFGDFDSSDTPEDPKVPFLWVGVGNQNAPANFGKVLRI